MPIVLNGSTGITTPTYNGSTTAEYLVPVTGFKNRIINGDMTISQRNGTSSVSVSNPGAYIIDRFKAENNTDGTLSAQQSTTAPAGFSNSLLFTVGTADASLASTQYAITEQRIEGFNTVDFGWGTANAATVTLSFWVRSSVTGTFGGSVVNNDFNRTYPFTYTVSAANTFEYKSITIAGDTSGTWVTNNGIGLIIRWGFGVGSAYSTTAGAWAAGGFLSATGATNLMATAGATFYITGVQLEKGSVATSFDYLPYTTELQLCQRYYQQLGSASGTANATTGFSGAIQFSVQMRATPTASLTNRMSITDTYSADYTQSAAAISFSGGNRVNTLGMNFDLANFSGLTVGRPYITIPVSYQNGIICMNAEL